MEKNLPLHQQWLLVVLLSKKLKQTVYSKKIALFVSLLVFLSCNASKDEANMIEGEVDERYALIQDDLYEDVQGNLYFRTLDRSAADDPENPKKGLRYNYCNCLYVDSLVSNDIQVVTVELKDVVDSETFHQLDLIDPNQDSVPCPLLISYYADRKNNYYRYNVADGGVLHKESELRKTN